MEIKDTWVVEIDTLHEDISSVYAWHIDRLERSIAGNHDRLCYALENNWKKKREYLKCGWMTIGVFSSIREAGEYAEKIRTLFLDERANQ
jgi:hypothetical protein